MAEKHTPTTNPKTKRTPTKRVKGQMPPHLVGKGFDVHPEHGNKKGRPKIRGMKDLQAAIREYLDKPSGKTKTNLDKLIEAMARNKGERKALLEFAVGRAPMSIRVEGEGITKTYIGISPDEWDELVKKKDSDG